MKKIKVGFDISQLAHQGGVATYTKNLAEKLSHTPDLEMLYFYSSLRKQYQGTLDNVKSFRLPPSLFEFFFSKWRVIGIERFIGPLDIFHSSDWTQPPAKAKKVTTYHDLVPLKYPQWSHPKIIEVHKRRLSLVEREADYVIAVSQATKEDLLSVSKIPEDRITVVYEGPTVNFQPQNPDAIRKFRMKYHLPAEFILAIGGVGERRNLERIKEASRDYNLVISGQSIPWLGIEELGLLYSSAKILVYCSLYEGFGIPILDAFSAGLPVITSNVSSMPEVGGEAALYADPFKIEDIKKKIEMVCEDQGLREDLIKKGLNRVQEFSWDKAANETAQVYRRMMS